MENLSLFDAPTKYEEAFIRFHRANPHVYKLFKRYTFEAIGAGRKHYSAKTIFERMRWHTDIDTKGEHYRLNNNHTAYYARKFEEDFPQYEGFFRKRTGNENENN